jgi:hypothetical protein
VSLVPVSLVLGGLVLGCASDGGHDFDPTRPTQAKAEIEQTKQAAESEPVPSETPPAGPEPAREPAKPVVTKPGVVQFETARVDDEAEPEPPSLFEAAAAERQRRASTAPSQIVITDANLGDFSDMGQLTEFTNESATDEAASDTAASDEEADEETLWRTRARDARLAWRAAADRISELEERVAELRYEFYSEDDPHHRDAVTKPAWDRAAIDLEQARLRVEEVRLQLDDVLAEGFAAGALPGWLREGMEFEPAAQPGDDRDGELDTAEAIEPPIAEEPPR